MYLAEEAHQMTCFTVIISYNGFKATIHKYFIQINIKMNINTGISIECLKNTLVIYLKVIKFWTIFFIFAACYIKLSYYIILYPHWMIDDYFIKTGLAYKILTLSVGAKQPANKWRSTHPRTELLRDGLFVNCLQTWQNISSLAKQKNTQ